MEKKFQGQCTHKIIDAAAAMGVAQGVIESIKLITDLAKTWSTMPDMQKQLDGYTLEAVFYSLGIYERHATKTAEDMLAAIQGGSNASSDTNH